MSNQADREATANGKAPQVKSAVRTVRVLECLSEHGREGARVRDVAESISAPKSSTYALLQTLMGEGWVEVDPSGNLYRLGIRGLLAGTSYLDSDPKVEVIRSVLSTAAAQVNETMHFGRLDGDQIVYLASIESQQSLRSFSRVGRRLPATATALGKAILSTRVGSPDFQLPDHIPALTPHTQTDRDAVLKTLVETQHREYATDVDESIIGVTCFAFTLRYNDPPQDAISCSVPTVRLVGDHESTVVEVLRNARDQIEAMV